MNILVSSSRGGGLKALLPRGTVVDVNPGGTYNDLKERVDVLLPPPHRLRQTPHVYVLGGVPDITELVKSKSARRYHYRESIFVYESDFTIERVRNEIRLCRSHILRKGATPIFCTIPKFHLAMYNNSLVDKNMTSFLLHSEHYADMQSRIDKVIDNLNDFIIQLNLQINMRTPCIHTSIRKRRGRSGHGYYIYVWSLYKDGLHANDQLKNDWAKALKVAFDKNRESEDSDGENHSPKRGWRREKRPRPSF